METFINLLVFLFLASIVWMGITLLGFISRTVKQKFIEKRDLKRTIIYLILAALLSGFLVGLIFIMANETPIHNYSQVIEGILPCVLGNLLIITFGFFMIASRLYSTYGIGKPRE